MSGKPSDHLWKGHVNSQSKVHEKKVVLNCPLSAMQGQPGKDHATFKSEPHLIMKVDDRQRLARERREEREKLIAARESLWLEKEIRARQHYEKHLEERKKKLEEQRMKEERRRAAVDEKRKLKLEEEKERYEAVVRRTAERNQRLKEKSNRWSWGGTLQSSIDANSSDPDRRSVSTMNLSKHFDPVINKRLSTSSATILNSPDKGTVPWNHCMTFCYPNNRVFNVIILALCNYYYLHKMQHVTSD
uniref:Microtubule-associated protein 7 n=1 Tax=Xenopus tropicalis TaxID=8364 RepID=A0A803KBW7_XENTR